MSNLDSVEEFEDFTIAQWFAFGTKAGGVEKMKAVLRGTLSLSVEITRRLSDLKHGTALPARTDEFDPKYFEGDGVYTTNNFKDFLLANAKKVASVPETQVAYCDLLQTANDAEIQAELPENHVFDGVGSLLPYVAGLIDRQKDGKAGDLLNNGYANIFYVRVDSEVFGVNVRWRSDGSGWDCFAFRLDDGRWIAGYRVFSATAVA